MASDELFDSSVRSAGDLAGVFECDGETAYFYLYDCAGDEGQKVLDSIHVVSGESELTEGDAVVRWDDEERKVGLFIRGVLWAVFDDRQAKYGGGYHAGGIPSLPQEALLGFADVT